MQNCDMKVLYVDLHMKNALSYEQLEILSQCSSVKEINKKIYEFFCNDPSARKLQTLSKVIKTYPSHENNQELATRIDKFVSQYISSINIPLITSLSIAV